MNRRVFIQIALPGLIVGAILLGTCLVSAWYINRLQANLSQVLSREVISLEAAKKTYETQGIDASTLAKRVEHIVQCCFNGRRIVVFSGGETNKDTESLLTDVRSLRDGGASGSIIGRNTFQRPRAEALDLLGKIIDIYLGKL